MKKIIILISVILLLFSCGNLKKLKRQKTAKKVEATIYTEKDNKDEYIFQIINKSNEMIPMARIINTNGHSFMVVSPSGQEYTSCCAHGSYKNTPPDGLVEFNFNIKHLIFKYHFTETGLYHCYWKYEKMGFNIHFTYYFDYEKVRKEIYDGFK